MKSDLKVAEKIKEAKKEIRKEKIPITFNQEQLKMIEEMGGILGNTKAEIIRNIVINWIIEKKGGLK